MSSNKKKRLLTQKEKPRPERSLRGKDKATGFDDELISWHVCIVDMGGPFGWTKAKSEIQGILRKLGGFETQTWADIKGPNNHAIPKNEICKDAQKRLIEINQDDIDKLFSFHLSGKKRVWGIQDRSFFKVLWWDPDHKICPSFKKHT